jgi:hypothetical protein
MPFATAFAKMLAKNNIAFLLNPVAGVQPLSPVTPPSTPPAAIHQPLCPTAIAATSLALLSAVCMSPMTEKRVAPAATHALKKRKLTHAVCVSDSSEEDEDEDTEHVKDEDVEMETHDGEAESTGDATAAKKKPRTPPCQVDGCKNMAVSRGCCVRHGGGSRCVVAGCANRAKLYKRCFQHGGYKTCEADNCSRKAKRYGYCWSHGGGRICEVDGCTKVSTQGGLCWAHGGGNRCKHDGCSRRSYLKYDYFCVDHADHSKSSTANV